MGLDPQTTNGALFGKTTRGYPINAHKQNPYRKIIIFALVPLRLDAYASLAESTNLRSMTYERSIIDTHRNAKWIINWWRIQFLFSEQLVATIKHQSNVPDWSKDPDVASAYMNQLATCFNSIRAFYETFGSLPLPGDNLLAENTGLKILNRRIDGGRRTVTFELGE